MDLDQLPWNRYIQLHREYSVTARELGQDPSRCVVELSCLRFLFRRSTAWRFKGDRTVIFSVFFLSFFFFSFFLSFFFPFFFFFFEMFRVGGFFRVGRVTPIQQFFFFA